MSRQRKHHRSLESKNQWLIFPCLELVWLQSKHTGQDFQKQLQQLILWMSALRSFRNTWCSKSTHLTCFGKSVPHFGHQQTRLFTPKSEGTSDILGLYNTSLFLSLNGNKNAYLRWLSHQFLCPCVMDEKVNQKVNNSKHVLTTDWKGLCTPLNSCTAKVSDTWHTEANKAS